MRLFMVEAFEAMFLPIESATAPGPF